MYSKVLRMWEVTYAELVPVFHMLFAETTKPSCMITTPVRRLQSNKRNETFAFAFYGEFMASSHIVQRILVPGFYTNFADGSIKVYTQRIKSVTASTMSI